MNELAPIDARPMWVCPACGRDFANRNQSHACGRHDVEHHFVGKPDAIRALFDQFATMLGQFGPVTILGEKTRIAFHVRMSFAQLTPRIRWIDGHFVLARRVEHPSFRRIETFSPRNHLHAFRLMGPADLTPTFRDFAAEAYAVGCQQHR